MPNPNWWREVRGVRISRNPHLGLAKPASPRDFTEAVHWIFDREGKDEHLRRQVYSLQVTPLDDEDLYIGLLNVLEWPKVLEPHTPQTKPASMPISLLHLHVSAQPPFT